MSKRSITLVRRSPSTLTYIWPSSKPHVSAPAFTFVILLLLITLDSKGLLRSHSRTSIHYKDQDDPLKKWCTERDLLVSKLEPEVMCEDFVAAAHSNTSPKLVLFHHIHKAGGSTLCNLAKINMIAESQLLPGRKDWDTNCVPYEAFLGPHPAIGASADTTTVDITTVDSGDPDTIPHHHQRHLQRGWLGGACWLGFITPFQFRTLSSHFAPLTFVASEGPLPDEIPLDTLTAITLITMLRDPLNRVLSSYKWWQYMQERWPRSSSTQCHAYPSPSPNSTFEQWLEVYPSNWMTRELIGTTALYRRRSIGLDRDDLEFAKMRLHVFSAVLILEEEESSMRVLSETLGWKDVGFK